MRNTRTLTRRAVVTAASVTAALVPVRTLCGSDRGVQDEGRQR
ncbi:hypothetical protein SALBM311S_04420 [Streptomyces alboniger]